MRPSQRPSASKRSLPFVMILSIVMLSSLQVHAQTYSLLYQFKSGSNGAEPYANVIVDSKGNLTELP